MSSSGASTRHGMRTLVPTDVPHSTEFCNRMTTMARCQLKWALALLAVTLSALASTAQAADQEGCLNCHQYRGLARVGDDGKTVTRFYVDPGCHTQGLGPHARLKCTDCHDRKQVEVFPHHTVSAVDCAKTCHLESSNKLETRFSHQTIGQMVQNSVHGNDVLDQCNQLLGAPLRKDQSKCLLCHDEPAFVRPEAKWLQQDASLARCNTCHDGQLPRNTPFSFWHVHARSRPARSNPDLIKVCGLCHSNPAVREKFDLPDAIASYVFSFHGKAVLLGSNDAAGCLDCHVGPMQNVHSMLSHKNEAASTSQHQLPDTCRSPTCHPAAGAQISSAAIHLNLPTSTGVEFLIACMFVLLIVFTFGPSLAITALKMVQIAVGRKEKDHEHHLHVAEKLMADPIGQRKLVRFTVHQRVQHWLLAILFTTLVLTGFPIKFADRPWAAWLITQFGGLPSARLLHRWAGVLLMAGFFYHMIYVAWGLIQERRKTGKNIFLLIWELPMLVRPQDGKEMLDLLLYVLFLKKKRPLGERFNAEEKFEYIGVFWGTFVLGVTGILMWANAWTSRYVPGRILTIAMLLHTFEAFLALLHVGIVHMTTVILSPGVFPISKAMFTGNTPTEELVEGHGAMLAEVEKELTTHGASTGEAQHHA